VISRAKGKATATVRERARGITERLRKHAPPRRGPLFRLLWPITAYLVTNFTVSMFWVLFRVFNRTTVLGREHIDDEPNTMLLSNHQSMIDSFLVGLIAYFPRALWKPHLLPWNPAAEENFYKTPLLRWFADNWKCIAIKEGRRDLHALHRMLQVLPAGVMTLFPEGTRTRDGSVGSGKPGAGLVILGARPRVIPVAIDGMQDVLPIGAVVPRLFKRIYVCYGRPIDYSDFLNQPRSREMAQALVDRVIEAIRGQLTEVRRMRGQGRSSQPSSVPPESPASDRSPS
jgi:1-acyl-sn-glycerol-3-phosphate acyltransferase